MTPPALASAVAFVPFTRLLVLYRNSTNSKDFLSKTKNYLTTRFSHLQASWKDLDKGFDKLKAAAIETLNELTKGIVPTICYGIFTAFYPRGYPVATYVSPTAFVTRSLPSSLLHTVINLYFIVLVYRSMALEENLPWFNIVKSAKAIFSEYERKKPWVILGTPGLLPAMLLQIIVELCILRPFASSLWQGYSYRVFIAMSILTALLRIALGTVLLTPLHVICTRQILTRNEAPPPTQEKEKEEASEDGNDESPRSGDQDDSAPGSETPEEYQQDEPISKETNREGFLNYLWQMYNEEGYEVFLRGYQLTVLSLWCSSVW